MSSVLHSIEKMVDSIYENPLSYISFLIFVIFLCKWLSFNSARNRNLPPSPPKMPILGHLHKLGMYPCRTLQSLSNRYGEIMLIHLGQTPALIVSSASAAKEILKTHDAVLSSRPKTLKNDKLLYNSRDVAAAPYGEYWRQMRSLMTFQLLSNRRIRSYRAVREEETAILVEKIMKSSSSAVNLGEMFTRLTNDIVCRVTFGRKYSGDQKVDVDFRELLQEFNHLLGVFNIGDFIPWMSWFSRLNGFNARLDDCAKKFDILIEDVIEEHLERKKHGSTKTDEEMKDFVEVLLEAQKSNTIGFPIERDSIKALLLDAFAAGTHTTSTALEWTMAELLRNPRIMNKAQQEVRGITRGKEVITEEDVEKMKYLKAVIKEIFRVHPPIPLILPRQSTQELKLNGYDIASGTLVFINAWAIHRDPVSWEEPEEFRPERFLESSVDFKGQDFELLPFGGGRRVCPGISFAIANKELVLATLLVKFNWSLPAGVTAETLDMSENTGLAASRKTPLFVVATPHVYP